jgi:hypothetical protein
MWSLHAGDNQMWYYDIIYHTIRTKVNDDFVLDINDNNRLVVNKFYPDAPNQRWMIYKDRVLNLENGKVLDICGADFSEGAEVCQWEWGNKDHQKFVIHYVEPKEFIIRSKMNRKAIDVLEKKTDPGTPVIMYKENGGDNQVWYESRDGIIHTKLNGSVLSSDGNTFQIQPYDDTLMERQWIKLGSKIVNLFKPEEVADIKGSNRHDGAKLVPWHFHGGNNQLWEYEWL